MQHQELLLDPNDTIINIPSAAEATRPAEAILSYRALEEGIDLSQFPLTPLNQTLFNKYIQVPVADLLADMKKYPWRYAAKGTLLTLAIVPALSNGVFAFCMVGGLKVAELTLAQVLGLGAFKLAASTLVSGAAIYVNTKLNARFYEQVYDKITHMHHHNPIENAAAFSFATAAGIAAFGLGTNSFAFLREAISITLASFQALVNFTSRFVGFHGVVDVVKHFVELIKAYRNNNYEPLSCSFISRPTFSLHEDLGDSIKTEAAYILTDDNKLFYINNVHHTAKEIWFKNDNSLPNSKNEAKPTAIEQLKALLTTSILSPEQLQTITDITGHTQSARKSNVAFSQIVLSFLDIMFAGILALSVLNTFAQNGAKGLNDLCQLFFDDKDFFKTLPTWARDLIFASADFAGVASDLFYTANLSKLRKTLLQLLEERKAEFRKDLAIGTVPAYIASSISILVDSIVYAISGAGLAKATHDTLNLQSNPADPNYDLSVMHLPEALQKPLVPASWVAASGVNGNAGLVQVAKPSYVEPTPHVEQFTTKPKYAVIKNEEDNEKINSPSHTAIKINQAEFNDEHNTTENDPLLPITSKNSSSPLLANSVFVKSSTKLEMIPGSILISPNLPEEKINPTTTTDRHLTNIRLPLHPFVKFHPLKGADNKEDARFFPNIQFGSSNNV